MREPARIPALPGAALPKETRRNSLRDRRKVGYMADETFCCVCARHVLFRESVWTETGQDLQSNTDALRAAKPRKKQEG